QGEVGRRECPAGVEAGASVTKRAHRPADCRPRLQTGGRTTPSALAGRRSYGAFVSRQPWPSTSSRRRSYHWTAPSASSFARAESIAWAWAGAVWVTSAAQHVTDTRN